MQFGQAEIPAFLLTISCIFVINIELFITIVKYW